MNAGQGCGNASRSVKLQHTDRNVREHNSDSWRFSRKDKEWVLGMKAPLYLVDGSRNSVWFLDVEAAGQSGNGRNVD